MAALPDRVEISKHAIRERAIAFSKRWAAATSEAAERQLFWNDFFAVFDMPLRSVGFFEVAAKRLSTGNRGRIDLLVPGEMAVEHKSAGGDLHGAMDQLLDYLDSLQAAAMPRLLVACDFQNFYWRDLETSATGRFTLEELSRNVELFWWLAGHGHQAAYEDEEEANLVATTYMAKLHDAVFASGYDPHALREWLTRILFCLFADDTEVWDRNAFTHYLFLNTRPDGSDLGRTLAELFQILNTPENQRATNLDEDLAAFTYINGDIFAATLPIPSCDEATRTALLDACRFAWSAISPAIFGSMFQNVMTPAERRQLGAHYTTEENILKTIRPLFLDDLEAELARCKSKAALDRLHDKLAGLTFMDPACGCGNFLVIAYRELRRLETELLHKRALATRQTGGQVMDVAQLCKLTVGQFYGIEIEEFPARIARTALYLMDHKANLEVSKELGQYFARFPIPTSPHITIGNALRMEWNDLLPAEQADYVLGNPPFVGKKARTAEQQEDMAIVFGDKIAGVLDYVTAWYEVASRYIIGTEARVAFVSTNSITQGEQVPVLWPSLLRRGVTIGFAHRTFAWSSEAKGPAHVHCVIVGFSACGAWKKPLRLFAYPDPAGEAVEEVARQINPYLADASPVIVGQRRKPFLGIPIASFGSMPNDGGHLLLDDDEATKIQNGDPIAAQYLRPMMSAWELLRDIPRWCLWLVGGNPADIAASPELRRRVEAVKQYRLASPRAATRKLADFPSLFGEIRQPSGEYLCVPRHVSESRFLLPMRFCSPAEIASDSTIAIPGADRFLFGILQSAMFTAWLRAIAGRIKSDIRVSVSVYNSFPFPDASDLQRSRVAAAAGQVLAARKAHPGASLVVLYDPVACPPDLVAAHRDLDRAADACFAPRRRLSTDAERLRVLFERYEQLASPMSGVAAVPRRRARTLSP